MANLTPKQEHFCYEYLRLGNASAAYRLAYDASRMKPETVWRKAHDVLKNGKVTARLESAHAKVAAKLDITLESLTAMLVRDRLLAREIKRPDVAIDAVDRIAALHGIGGKVGKSNPGTGEPRGLPDIAGILAIAFRRPAEIAAPVVGSERPLLSVVPAITAPQGR